MHNHSNYYYDYQQLYAHLQESYNQIQQLQTIVQQLQHDINMLKQQQATTIEYKFDQLKVERLEGTLNIGVTPSNAFDPNSIEDFSVQQDKLSIPTFTDQHPQAFRNIQNEIYDYLNHDSYRVLESIEHRNNYQLDGPYRQFIMEDVKRQIDDRIRYYLNQINNYQPNEEALQEIHERTTAKVKEDINKTLEEFFLQMQGKVE